MFEKCVNVSRKLIEKRLHFFLEMQPLPMYKRCHKRIFQNGILKCEGKANLAQNFIFPE